MDSRFKTSGSNSNFTYNLPESISLPENVLMYVDNIVIPNSWKTIDSTNNKLYVKRTAYATSTITTYKIVELAEHNYSPATLRAELECKLNSSANFTSTFCTITYDQVLLRMDINLTASAQVIKIYTDEELENTNDFPLQYDKTYLQSTNEIFSIHEPHEAQFYKTSIINLMRYRNLYLTCPSLSNYETLAPNGNSNVIRTIPVNASYGDVSYNNVFSLHDYVDVSRLMLKTLEFQVCDTFGRVINLRNIPVSFSLIFMKKNMD